MLSELVKQSVLVLEYEMVYLVMIKVSANTNEMVREFVDEDSTDSADKPSE